MEKKELEQREKEIEGLTIANRENIKSVEQRKADALSKQADLQSRYEAVRGNRQKVLATGGDAGKLNTQIKDLKNEIELIEDEIAGLEQMHQALSAEEAQLKEEAKEVATAIKEAELSALAAEYNKLAAKMAPVVARIWDLRFALGETYLNPYTVISQGGWENNALSEIPKLYLRGDSMPGFYVSECYFFHYGTHIRRTS